MIFHLNFIIPISPSELNTEDFMHIHLLHQASDSTFAFRNLFSLNLTNLCSQVNCMNRIAQYIIRSFKVFNRCLKLHKDLLNLVALCLQGFGQFFVLKL